MQSISCRSAASTSRSSESTTSRIHKLRSNTSSKTTPDLPVVGLISNRLLKSDGFVLPKSLEAHCRLEDLSPTLVATLVQSTLERKRAYKENLRLTQELNFAVHLGELGSWTLDTETGRISLSESAAQQIGVLSADACPLLDDLLELVHSGDQDNFKRQLNQAIEDQSELEVLVRLNDQTQGEAAVSISAKFRAGGPRANPSLYGFIKRNQQNTAELQEQITAANQAIQKALNLRDEAIATASQELDALMKKVGLSESTLSPRLSPEPKPRSLSPRPSSNAKPETEPRKVVEEAKESPVFKEDIPEHPAAEPTSDHSLGIDKSQAMEKVLKSINSKKSAKTERKKGQFPIRFLS